MKRKRNPVNDKKQSMIVEEDNTMKKIISLFLALLLMTAVLNALAEETTPTDDPLSLWTEDAVAKEMLITYMAAITDENGEDYIPPIDRIAVFDLDGTLFCETDPNYFDYTLLVYRVLEDPDYKDKASDFEWETAL